MENAKKIEIENLRLWVQFKEKAEKEGKHGNIADVEKLIKGASSLLDKIQNPFQSYTLHNHVHAENVVKLMGDLLGKEVEKITTLEGAILILSAYYHDIGMLYRDDQLKAIGNEDDFEIFKRENPKAIIKIHENNGTIPSEIAEWYCRSIHPNRVYIFLDEIEDSNIKWGVVTLKDTIGSVCQSHGYGVREILVDDNLRTDFMSGKADLKFCAILLRLADILDFDNSRSPEEVYKFLKISERKDESGEKSDTEWRKHLCSEGFKFPSERDSRYELGSLNLSQCVVT